MYLYGFIICRHSVNIIRHRKKFFILSSILVVASIVALSLWQLNFGIDFTGGSLLEIEVKGRELSTQEIKDRIANLELENLLIQPTGSNGFILRFQDVDEETHQAILTEISQPTADQPKADNFDFQNDNDEVIIETLDGGEESISVDAIDVETAGEGESGGIEIIEKRFESIGPVIGQELKRKSLWAIILVLIAIVLYIAWVFRKVSRPIASWRYGVVAIVALFHDLLIVLGIFSFLGHFYGVEIGLPFVAAILTILGYSVNDTIVVFDRTRENLISGCGEESFGEVVNQSLNQTITRSVNTSLTTLFVLLAIFMFGGASLKDFIIALMLGVIFGTYSSIFVASPLLVEWEKKRNG